jgi:hypothetical protein
MTARTPVHSQRISQQQILLRSLQRENGSSELNPILDSARPLETETEQYRETDYFSHASYRPATDGADNLHPQRRYGCRVYFGYLEWRAQN